MRKQSLEEANYRKADTCENCANIYYSYYGPNKQVGSWCRLHQTLINKKCVCSNYEK